MRLFLASEAKNVVSFKKLETYIGGFKGKSIAYIPTASNGEQEFGSWIKNSASWELLQTIDAHVVAVQLEDYKDSTVIDQLQNKDILWVAGGQPGYLMYWMRRCQLDTALSHILKRSLYVGSSAGSMVAAHTLNISEWYLGENEHGASVIPGLGLVDFDIYPHFEDYMLSDIQKIYTGKKLYLLKNGEEIIVENRRVSVSGVERIIPSSVVHT